MGWYLPCGGEMNYNMETLTPSTWPSRAMNNNLRSAPCTPLDLVVSIWYYGLEAIDFKSLSMNALGFLMLMEMERVLELVNSCSMENGQHFLWTKLVRENWILMPLDLCVGFNIPIGMPRIREQVRMRRGI